GTSAMGTVSTRRRHPSRRRQSVSHFDGRISARGRYCFFKLVACESPSSRSANVGWLDLLFAVYPRRQTRRSRRVLRVMSAVPSKRHHPVRVIGSEKQGLIPGHTGFTSCFYHPGLIPSAASGTSGARKEGVDDLSFARFSESGNRRQRRL